jgi:hypothetical protein
LQDKTVEYRSYKIKQHDYTGFYFTHGDYDAEWTGDGWSDNATSADSIEHAIELINEEIAERQRVYVFIVSNKYIVAIPAESLEEAYEHSDVSMRKVALLSVNKIRIEDYKFPR